MIQRKDYLNSIFSGILLVLSYPNFSISSMAWIALVPLLLTLQGKDLKSAGKLGFLTGFVFFYGLLYWLNALIRFDKMMILGTVGLAAILAFYVSAFCILLIWLSRNQEKNYWLLVPLIWTTLEYIRGLGPLGFPWGLLGYSQSGYLTLIQFSSITGVLGISFLILMVNGIIACMMIKLRNRSLIHKRILVQPVTAIIIIILVYIYGLNRNTPVNDSGSNLKVAIIQGNVPQEMKWDEEKTKLNFNKHIDLTKSIINHEPDLIVWPETAIADIFSEIPIYENALRDISTTHHVYLLVGTLDVSTSSGEERFYNAVYLMETTGVIEQKYYKTHLVPFGEYFPGENKIPILRKLNLVPSHFSAGKDLTLYRIIIRDQAVNFSSLICFESILPSLARAMVNNGAQLLVIVTNDSWFGKTSAPYQHNDIAIFRAIETGVPIVRAANTGYSCFIDSKGRILQGLNIYQDGTLVQEINIDMNQRKTVYAKYGDWFPFLLGIILLGWMIYKGKTQFQKQ